MPIDSQLEKLVVFRIAAYGDPFRDHDQLRFGAVVMATMWGRCRTLKSSRSVAADLRRQACRPIQSTTIKGSELALIAALTMTLVSTTILIQGVVALLCALRR